MMKFFKFLKQFDKDYKQVFQFCTSFVSLVFNESIKTFKMDEFQYQAPKTLLVIEKNNKSILVINLYEGRQQDNVNMFVPSISVSSSNSSSS